MSDYSELKKAAEAAIQIDWERLKSGLNDRYPSDYADHILSASPAAVLALIAENESLRRDAERLEFMEKEWFYIESCGEISFSFKEMWTGSGGTLRSAIDSEIAKEKASD